MFKNRISIQVERNLVSFSKDGKSQSFRPSIYLDTASIVCGVGELPSDIRDSIRVDLFQEPKTLIDHSEALVAFLRHGISSLLGKHWFQPRPRIDFTISPDVAIFLRFYHKAIFRDAAIAAGAMHDAVTFTSSYRQPACCSLKGEMIYPDCPP